MIFFSFYIVFIVNSKGAQGHYSKLNLLNIIKKHVGASQVDVWTTLALFRWFMRDRPATKYSLSRWC